MLIFVPILISLLVISLLSFTGALTLTLKKKFLQDFIVTFTSFAAGTLLAAAFFDLMPEGYDLIGQDVFKFVLVGIIIFFILERIIHWHHCHDEHCDVHAEGPLNLIGDGIHNFLDGGIIAAAYLVNIPLGITTTIAVAAHEIPQEIGDFAVLIHSGFSESRALLFNFLSALTAVLGGILTIYFSSVFEMLVPVLVSISAGGFIYIATADLLPAISRETNRSKMILNSFSFLLGIVLLYFVLTLGN